MAIDMKEVVNALRGEDVRVNILVLNGSPRAKNNSQIPMDRVIQAVNDIPGTALDTFHFHGKNLEFCRHCLAYCSKHMNCVHKDDFHEFKKKWIWADGMVWVTPVYHMGPPGKLRSVIDRLSEVEFHTVHTTAQEKGVGYIYPRFMKAVGAVVHGGTRYGGQEITLQYFLNHTILLDNVPVTGDMPECYLGAAGYSPDRETLEKDEVFLESAYTVGKRVTEMAKIIKAAKIVAAETIPSEYYSSKQKMGAISKEEFLDQL